MRRTCTRGIPAPRTSAIPTARRCRSTPGVPGANAARRISSRKFRARSGSGSRTTPSAPTVSGGVPFKFPTTRTSVGRRTPGTGSSVSEEIVSGRGVTHSSWTPWWLGHCATHGCDVPSKALEARKPGRPWKRDDPKNSPRTPASRSIAGSTTSLGTLPQPSTSQVRAAGGENTRVRPRSPSPRSRTSAALAEPCSLSRRNGSSPVVRWNTYVRLLPETSAPASARSASTGVRNVSVTPTFGISSSRMPAVTFSPSGASVTIWTDSRVTSLSPTGRWFQPACTG